MSTYKITNITSSVDKRHVKYNSILSIEYVDEMERKEIKIKPNETIFITIPTIPLSVQRLRIKNLLSVTEVDSNELNKVVSKTKEKTVKTTKSSEIKHKTDEKQSSHIQKKKQKKDDEIAIAD